MVRSLVFQHRSGQSALLGRHATIRFIAAGGAPYYSDFLKKLSPGDRVFAYQKQAGYVGYGIVTSSSVPVRDFVVNNSSILKLPLESRGLGHDVDNLDKCEYLAGIDWRKTLPLSEAKTFPGVFANQNIVGKLRDATTIEFLKRVFPVQEKSRLQERPVGKPELPVDDAGGPGSRRVDLSPLELQTHC